MTRRFGVSALLVAAWPTAACVEDDTTESPNTRETAVVVDPEQFLGSFPCGAVEGAPQSYLASVIDLESNAVIGTSARVACGASVAFTDIEDGHRYAADIQVFDQPPGVAVNGPAWQTSCGKDGVGAAEGRLLEQVTIRGCAALSGPGTAETGVVVDGTALASDLGCVDDGGVVDTLVVTPDDGTLPELTIACGQAAARYQVGVVEGESYRFAVTAPDDLGETAYGAVCTATAQAGLVMPASCTPLTDRGALELPVAALLLDVDRACGETVSQVEISLVAGAVTTSAKKTACNVDSRLDGLPRGPYLASARLLDGTAEVASFACTGSVTPGAVTPLVCTREN